MLDFLSPLSLVPGMGPKRLAAFGESAITTIGNLLYRFPRRYLDRSEIIPINSLTSHEGKTVSIRGTIEKVSVERGRRSRLRVLLSDESGSIELLWFQGIAWLQKSIRKEQYCLVTGTVGRYTKLQIVHPQIETISRKSTDAPQPIVPLYNLTEAMRTAGVGQRFLQKTVSWILKNLKHYPQILPRPIAAKHPFPPLEQCLRELHFPSALSTLDTYRERIRFEELYQLALTLRMSKKQLMRPGRSSPPGTFVEHFTDNLPFTLTKAQSDAVMKLHKQCSSSRRMHCLLQGDVGSGKTVVAFIAALPALQSGLQIVSPCVCIDIQYFSSKIKSFYVIFYSDGVYFII